MKDAPRPFAQSRAGQASARARWGQVLGTGTFNRLDVAADHGLTIFTYAAEPGSRSEEALKLLGSWAATFDTAEAPSATEQR